MEGDQVGMIGALMVGAQEQGLRGCLQRVRLMGQLKEVLVWESSEKRRACLPPGHVWYMRARHSGSLKLCGCFGLHLNSGGGQSLWQGLGMGWLDTRVPWTGRKLVRILG